LKENLYNFYTANKHLSRKEIFDRFIAIGAPERSLNRWPCNLEKNKTLKRKKVFVWIAISPKGMTEPFFREPD